jgi:hypothetical protein
MLISVYAELNPSSYPGNGCRLVDIYADKIGYISVVLE